MSEDRQPKEGEYTIPSASDKHSRGLITCYREGLKLIDFYRTSTVLAKDVPPVDKDKQYTKDTP